MILKTLYHYRGTSEALIKMLTSIIKKVITRRKI